MALYIAKASGEREEFNAKKFSRSLQKAGADPETIEKLIADIVHAPELQSTKDIYNYAFNYLKSVNRPAASRYSIKKALYDLGPDGFPFEKFVSEIFKAQNYETRVDQVVHGKCVEHEIDVIAVKNNQHFMIECKFHNSPGTKTDVVVALYIKARFDDVAESWRKISGHKLEIDQVWLVTNTKFTSHAIEYGECTGMRLLGWGYPEKNNIADLIDSYGLYPITCLTSLSSREKKILLEQAIILCKDLQARPEVLSQFRFNPEQINYILAECEQIFTQQPNQRHSGSPVNL